MEACRCRVGWSTHATIAIPKELTSSCDEDGGEMFATAIFSFRTCVVGLADRQIKQEIVRKARHLLKRAATAI